MKKTVQVNATKACLQIAGLNLFYVKKVPARAMRACSQIAGLSLFYVKTVPARAMRTCSQIAGLSLLYSKIHIRWLSVYSICDSIMNKDIIKIPSHGLYHYAYQVVPQTVQTEENT